jgi:hypothetical protein
MFYWPVILTVLAISKLSNKKINYIIGIGSLTLIGLLYFEAYKLIKQNGFKDKYNSSELSCIDHAIAKAGLHNGIAGYWDAKPIQSFSTQALRIAQYTNSLEEYRWETTTELFRDTYDFAIISLNQQGIYKLSPQLIIKINGKPASTVQCGNKLLLIYGRDRLHVKPH